MFEDIKHERFLILLLSLVELDILKQSKFSEHEMIILNILHQENCRDRDY